MEVKINKEIREFSEAVFFGMSLRQCTFAVLACGVAVGLYFLCSPYLGIEALSWVCIIGAAPFVAVGFIKWHGMTAEQFVWAWLKSEILSPKLLVAKPSNLYYEAVSNPMKQKKKDKKADGQMKVEKVNETSSTPAAKDELPVVAAIKAVPAPVPAASEEPLILPAIASEPIETPASITEELPVVSSVEEEPEPLVGRHSKPGARKEGGAENAPKRQPKHARKPNITESEVSDSYAENTQ